MLEVLKFKSWKVLILKTLSAFLYVLKLKRRKWVGYIF